MTGPPLRVLVAEDDRLLRALYAEVFATPTWDAVLVDNGLAALVAVGRCDPEVIILDLHMPLADGIEVIGALRADPASEGLPVIVISGAYRRDHPVVRDLTRVAYYEKGVALDLAEVEDYARTVAQVRRLRRAQGR